MQLVKLAVSAGRSHQSPQTGYIHFCPYQREEDLQDTIPVMENILFALALLCTRNMDSTAEGNALLGKMLAFQNRDEGDSYGNFPVYIHEFPKCKDPLFGSQLLVPLFWLLKEETPYLNEEILKKTKEAASLLLEQSLRTLKIDSDPFQKSIRIAAACKAFGDLWQDENLQKRGEEYLSFLKKQSESENFGTWFSPVYLADTLVALQMIYPKISESPWKTFWEQLIKGWSRQTFCYVGPKIRDFQEDEEPQATFYDLAMGFLVGTFPYRAYTEKVYQLHGIQLHPTEDEIPLAELPFDIEGNVAGFHWKIHQTNQYAYSLIQKVPLPEISLEKQFFPFSLSWGDKNMTHTFVCQGGNSSFTDFKANEEAIDLFFTLDDPLQMSDKDKEKCLEVVFFCNQHDGWQIQTVNKSFPTFQLDDSVTFSNQGMKFHLVFKLLEGDGRFVGQITSGNRPAQINNKGPKRFNKFDWQIALRTLRRYTPCRIKVEIRIEKTAN